MKRKWHPLILRQLRKSNLDIEAVESDVALMNLLRKVSSSYFEADEYRYMMERSLSVSSDELKSYIAEQKRSVSLLQATLNSTADGILVSNAEGEMMIFNDRFADMWHLPFEVKQSKDDKAFLENAMHQLVNPEGFFRRVNELYFDSTYESFDEILFKDGRVVERYSIPLTVKEKMLGRVWSFRDVTASRQSEKKLAQSERMASVGTLAAGVAHEINNPLTYCIMSIELLKEECENFKSKLGRLSEEEILDRVNNTLQSLIGPIGDGLKRVKDIVENLKTFSRLELESNDVIDLPKVIQVSADMAQGEIRNRASLKIDLDKLPKFWGNESKLVQVFLNIIVNAAQAIGEGDVEHNSISIKSNYVKGDSFTVSITDTGPGIPEELLKQIFDPFFSTKPRGRGTGLGLSICLSIMQELKGELSVESRLGNGTTFYIKFKIKDIKLVDEETSKKTVNTASHDLKKLFPLRETRVLIIDDEVNLVESVSRALRKMCQVETALNGLDGLEILKRDGNFDVILCDMMMPNITGMEFFEKLQELRSDLCQKIIFMTGGTYTDASKKFVESLHSCQLIMKPFGPAEIRKVISDFLARTESQRAI